MDHLPLRSLEQELHPPLSAPAALIESEHCLFCHDAPCTRACPSGIDVPLFIRQINTGNTGGAARTIFAANILGGMCARVCPTETLCEGECVRNEDRGAPVKIGLLQRFATDALMASGEQPMARAAPSGKRVAVVGAGPAGIACAHRLAVLGHAVSVFEARDKGGGLNEFGIAAYKSVDDFARRELEYVLDVGGIALHTAQRIGSARSLGSLLEGFDAVFLGAGLGAVNALAIEGEVEGGVLDAVDFIAALRQRPAQSAAEIAARVAVVGGGMTAIDAAVQATILGAREVWLLYRGPRECMKASALEQRIALQHGVRLLTETRPLALCGEGGVLRALRVEGPEGRRELAVEQVLMAIGQRAEPALLAQLQALGAAIENGKLCVDTAGRSSVAKLWAGGDCVERGEDLTVEAVEAGKRAAIDIDHCLSGER